MSPEGKTALTVKTSGGTAVYKNSYKLTFKCERDCFVWHNTTSSCFALSFLKSPSGTGKSTFLFNLYKRLKLREEGMQEHINSRRESPLFNKIFKGRPLKTNKINFDFTPDLQIDTQVSIGYIPQDPSFINHWKLCNILPEDDLFLDSLFPEESKNNLSSKRLGQFSGGQQIRIYMSSALNKLVKFGSKSEYFFLLLDEAFDGLGAINAGVCIGSIKNVWKKEVQKPLYLFIITHLNNEEVIKSIGEEENITKIKIDFLSENSKGKVVNIYNE